MSMISDPSPQAVAGREVSNPPEDGVKSGLRRRRGGAAGESGYTRLNDRYGYFLAAFVILVAIPQASNPPAWWLAASILVFLAAGWHLLRGMSLAPERALGVMQHKPIVAIALTVPFIALVQSLPIAGLLPTGFGILPDGVTAAPGSISLMPVASAFGAVRVLAYIVFFALILEVAGQGARAERIGWIIFFGIAVHAFWALISLNVLGDIAIWGEKTAYAGSATGTFVNRNSFATYLGFGFVLGVALTIERARRPRIRSSTGRTPFSPENLETLALGGLCLVILITIVATQSRLGLVATLAGAVVTVGALRLKSDVPTRRVLAEGAMLFVVLFAVGFAGGGVGVIERAIFVEGDAGFRFELYAQALRMIGERPWLGWGWDSFAPAFELMRAEGIRTDRILQLAHSTYLTNWLELGIFFGSAGLVAGALAAGALMRRLIRRATNIAMPSAGLGVIVVGAVHSTMDFSLEIPANMFAFIAIIGLGIANRRRAALADKD